MAAAKASVPTPPDPLDVLERSTRVSDDDIFDALDDAPESVPVATLKEEGDKVQGIVVYIGEITNEYGTSKVLHLQDRDGTIRSVGMFGARLNNWFAKTQPEYGDAVRIVCKGMTKTKNGKNEFRDFDIAYVAHGTVRAATS